MRVIRRALRKNREAAETICRCWKYPDKYIPVKGLLKYRNGIQLHNNWGDDMNRVLIEKLSGKTVLSLPDTCVQRIAGIHSYLVVGSTLSFISLDHVTVWGAGIINENEKDRISGKPDRITAVRGPLTARVLREKGYDCPDVFGDPILLLPKLYGPKKEQRYDIGIIPHYTDRNLELFQLFDSPRMRIIEVRNYSRWQDFVDQICSCRLILSSSLHGLICAEAYGIPAIWTGFSDYRPGWEFKFRDFYKSIQKDVMSFVPIRDAASVESEVILRLAAEWRPGRIDLSPLLSACPFLDRTQFDPNDADMEHLPIIR